MYISMDLQPRHANWLHAIETLHREIERYVDHGSPRSEATDAFGVVRDVHSELISSPTPGHGKAAEIIALLDG